LNLSARRWSGATTPGKLCHKFMNSERVESNDVQMFRWNLILIQPFQGCEICWEVDPA
jgi:hypothetical protein